MLCYAGADIAGDTKVSVFIYSICDYIQQFTGCKE
jgi:hypothetical protein